MSYVSNRKLTNVVGRIDYISNPQRQEEIVDYYTTQPMMFWQRLGSENRQRFSETSNRSRKNVTPQEAREFIIAIPQTTDTENLVRDLCMDFKWNYGVECAAAIHHKAKNDNLHIHLIYADRQLLQEPVTVEEKVAPRTYYYDSKGKKCKKADAVKVVKKGTVLQHGGVRYFGDKINFYSMGFVNRFKKETEERFYLTAFDPTRHFATKHVGKNNPKAKYILEYNRLIREMNDYFDSIEPSMDSSNGTPLQIFCDRYNIYPYSAYQNDRLNDLFQQFKEDHSLEQKAAQNVTERVISDEELCGEYISTIKQAVDLDNDISSMVNKYRCPYDILKTNASWERNGYPIDWYEQDWAVNKVNHLIEKHSIDHDPISSRESPSSTLKAVDRVVDLLNTLFNRITEKIYQLKEKLIDRGIPHSDPNQIAKEIRKAERNKSIDAR